MKKLTILVIDDNLSILEELTDILRYEGFTVYGANNGLSGIRKAKKIKPDLILCDIFMPDINGYEVVSRLKNIDDLKYIPIILVSASVLAESIQKGFDVGAADFLKKPFETETLLEKIKTVFEKVK